MFTNSLINEIAYYFGDINVYMIKANVISVQ